jgi:hypothetical protein
VERINCRFWFTLFFAVCLTSCMTPLGKAPRSDAYASAGAGERFAQAPQDRPGLGTKWGETRDSRSTSAAFHRATESPLANAAIYYNNPEGIRAMAGATPWRRTWSVVPSPFGKLASIGLRDQSGRFLPGLIVGDRWFVIGEEGRRYSIVVRNNSDSRIESVLSVDGLDVIDGRAASFRKRGYIIEPHRKLVVDGFRQSADAVAAFRFSPVRESYANEKYHNTRNVGVIGITVFMEGGSYPLTDREVQKRLNANPFPDRRFATPPNQ